MKLARAALVSVVALGLAACSSAPDADNGDQAATGQNAPKPALLKVTFKSTVGVLLDEAPDADALEQKLLADSKGGAKDAFWKERAKRQLRLTLQRVYYRGNYYPGGLADDPEDKDTFEHPVKAQLPLPPDVDEAGNDLWVKDITLSGDAQAKTIDGHRHVVRDFTYEGYILTDDQSPGRAEPALAKIGGVWVEPTKVDGDDESPDAYALPVDPDLILQRTGFACMTEAEFPPNSVDSENAWRFYDFTCKADLKSGCHLAPDDPAGSGRPIPTESCVEALTRTTGIVKTTLRYERIDTAGNKALMDKVRVGNPAGKNGADMTVRKDSLGQNRIVWRYVSDDSCEMKEENNCVTGPGWRRVLEFDAVGHNVGTKPIHIGRINYAANDKKMSTQNDEHGVFQYSSCHHHFHFDQYGTFTLDGGKVSNRKNGFCLESTVRYSNNEFSPIATQYGRCTLQGVEVGWGDEYEAGIVCQWIDVTNQAPGKVDLGFQSNPGGFLCEGSLADEKGKPTFDKADANGLPTPFSVINEDTGWEPVLDKNGQPIMFTPKDLATGEPVVDDSGKPVEKPIEKPKCKPIANWDKNNAASVPVALSDVGGYVSRACPNEEFGPLRDCGYRHETPDSPKASRSCKVGETVHLTCSTKSARPQVVRFCEASMDPGIGGAMDCMHADALRLQPGTPGEGQPQSLTVAPGASVDVQFTCPDKRDHEEGGHYAIYTGAFYSGDQAEVVSCEVQP